MATRITFAAARSDTALTLDVDEDPDVVLSALERARGPIKLTGPNGRDHYVVADSIAFWTDASPGAAEQPRVVGDA